MVYTWQPLVAICNAYLKTSLEALKSCDMTLTQRAPPRVHLCSTLHCALSTPPGMPRPCRPQGAGGESPGGGREGPAGHASA